MNTRASANESHGDQIEEVARQVAATLGVADFVFTVPTVSKGAGVREVGDALLISNGLGAVLQVKARHPSASGKAESWIGKHGGKAYKQGVGSLREIERHVDERDPLLAIPVRAADLELEDRKAPGLLLDYDSEEWPIIVIIDHPEAVGVDPPEAERAFWITLDDWHQLNRALRSVTGLLIYVRRVLEHGDVLQVPLGREEERFAQLAKADELSARSGFPTSRPWLTFDALEDPLGAELYHQLLRGVWPEGQPLPKVPIEHVRQVLEFLDATPPGVQVETGRWILRKRQQLADTKRWSSGSILIDRERLLVFASDLGERYESLTEFDAELAALGALRANEISEQRGHPVPSLAIGHLIDDDGIDYRYVLTPKPLDLPADLRRMLVHRFGRFDLELGQVVAITAEPSDLCPCGSGQEFRACASG